MLEMVRGIDQARRNIYTHLDIVISAFRFTVTDPSRFQKPEQSNDVPFMVMHKRAVVGLGQQRMDSAYFS